MNEITLIFLLVICACALVLVGVSIIEDVLIYKNEGKDELEEDIYSAYDNSKLRDVELLLKPDAISTIDGVLDQCIKDAGDIYNIMILAPKQFGNDSNAYINEAEQNRMTEYIVQSVHARMSYAMLSLLQLSYKIQSEEDLDKVIRLRVKLYMINFILNYNGLK